MKQALLAFSMTVLLFGVLAVSAGAATGIGVDQRDAARADNISNFNLGQFPMEVRAAAAPDISGRASWGNQARPPRSVGSAMSPNAGIGPGVRSAWDG